MKLDLLYEFQPKIKPWSQPHPYGQRDAEQRTYDEAIVEIQYADTLGFNTVWVVEHHFRDGRSASPCSEAILGGLALSTERIKLGFGVTLMPFGFVHPARVAEKVATVDVLSHGRVEWGTGRSTPMEQAAFGVPTDDRSREQWREAVEIVVKMWEQETFSWDSENLKFPERMQTPKPYQDPHPPCWQAAASETSAVSAGERGLGLLSFALLQPVEKMAEHIRAYRTAQAVARAEDMLTRVQNDRVGVYTLVHCYDDADEAAAYGLWESVNWWYKNLAEFTLQWELPMLSEEEQRKVFPLLDPVIKGEVPVEHYQTEDMIIIGTPDECLAKILRYEQVGVDQLLCYVQFGDLPHDKVMRTLELLSKEVMPRLEERGHRVDRDSAHLMDLISGLRYQAAKEQRPLHADLAAAFSLDGRTAVVTGAAMGIGRQTAYTYAQAGANVVLADRNAERLAESAAEVEQLGVKVIVVPTDVSNKAEVDELARQAVKGTGRLDVWANVAGVIGNSLVVDTTEDDIDAIVSVNLKGVYWGSAAAARVMSAAGRGSIVNVASAGGEMPAPTLSVYAMTKAGVIQFTRTLAAEVGAKGVRANAVAPGFIETPMTQRAWTNPDGSVDETKRAEVLGLRGGQSPLGTTGTPEDIAWSMLFLAADASRFMTGQVMRPNGGVYMA